MPTHMHGVPPFSSATIFVRTTPNDGVCGSGIEPCAARCSHWLPQVFDPTPASSRLRWGQGGGAQQRRTEEDREDRCNSWLSFAATSPLECPESPLPLVPAALTKLQHMWHAP